MDRRKLRTRGDHDPYDHRCIEHNGQRRVHPDEMLRTGSTFGRQIPSCMRECSKQHQCEGGEGHYFTMPPAFSAAICASVIPSSRNTPSVCSPCVGAPRCGRAGVAENRIGCPVALYLPTPPL